VAANPDTHHRRVAGERIKEGERGRVQFTLDILAYNSGNGPGNDSRNQQFVALFRGDGGEIKLHGGPPGCEEKLTKLGSADRTDRRNCKIIQRLRHIFISSSSCYRRFFYMIRVILPQHLRTLAHVGSEVEIEVVGAITLRSVLDAIEARYPMIAGTIRDHDTLQRRPFLRFFACEEDLSHQSADAPLPEAVVLGKEPLIVIGAIAGG
jgi:molybdopterin synthase sulfur carrier subunit